MAKHNWQIIKEEYVQAPDDKSRPTLEELSAKYKCSSSYLREKASKENWKLEAERYIQTVASKRQEQKSTALAGELADWDAKCFNAAQAGLSQIYAHMKAAHEQVQRDGEPLSLHQLDLMSKALERIQRIGKTAMGEQEETRINLKVDYSKLSDEQLQRIAAGEDPRDVLAAA